MAGEVEHEEAEDDGGDDIQDGLNGDSRSVAYRSSSIRGR